MNNDVDPSTKITLPDAVAATIPPVADAPASHDAADAPHGPVRLPNLRREAMTSAAWIMIAVAAGIVIRILSSVILTRFLHPDIYGLMDLVNAFLLGLVMFSDVGIATCIVQSQRGEEPVFLNTAWTLQLLRGLLLWLGSALLAKPVALFYDQPILVLVMPVVGITALLDALNSTAIPLLGRRLQRGRLVALELIKAVTTLAVTLGWIYVAYPDLFIPVLRRQVHALPADESLVWSMAVGGIGGYSIYMLLSHVILPGHRSRLRWERSAVDELLGFGKWVFLGTIFTYLAFQTAPLIVPALIDFKTAGLYGRALALAAIATSVMSQLTAQLVFPVYSRLHQMGRDIRIAFVQVHTSAATFAALLTTGLLCCGPTVVQILYPPEWNEAGWILQFLAVGAWFQMLESTAGASLLALGKAGSVMISNATKFFSMIVFVPLGFWLGKQSGEGLVGMILGFIASDLLRYAVVVVIARLNGMSAWIYDVGLSALIVGFSYAATAIGAGLAEVLLGQPPSDRPQLLLQFLFQGTTAVLLWGVVLLAMYKTGNLKLRGIGKKD